MKKVVLLFSAVILAAGITFAQTPQDKTAKPATKTETTKDSKDSKGGCDEKTKAACSSKSKSCCAKDEKKAAPAATPEKK
jgi:hypothetical protein